MMTNRNNKQRRPHNSRASASERAQHGHFARTARVADDTQTFLRAPVSHNDVPFGQSPEAKAAQDYRYKAAQQWLGQLSPRKKRQALHLLRTAK